MKYFTQYSQNSAHSGDNATGVLLVNLGTPDSPSKSDVRRYLKEFLWDPRVVEAPRPLWWLVLNLVILNTRPGRSAAAYRKIWTDAGSPLLTISRAQELALRERVEQRFGNRVHVALAMRYGSPSIRSGLRDLAAQGVERVLVLPLYPQYSATTTASIFDAVHDELAGWRNPPALRNIKTYHDHPGYIAALAQSVRAYWQTVPRPDLLLMSFHGIPEEYFHSGDPYFCLCHKTARLLAEALELGERDYQVSFQSRLGPKQWLQPYTDHSLERLARSGTKNVQVICPGFSVDCLETLEEIAMENRDVFLAAGGETYHYIPCLNDSEAHMKFLLALVEENIEHWVADPVDTEILNRQVHKLEQVSHDG